MTLLRDLRSSSEIGYFFVCKAVVGLAAGGDAAFFFYVLLVFGVGETSGATFGRVGDKGVAFVICRHIGCFAVEFARCIVVTAIRAGFVAGGVGVPEIRDGVCGRLTTKGAR